MLVALGSVKGSPGVTSLAVALAARWPVPRALVVEADPAGGDLAARFGLSRSPGLGEWAADTRTGGPLGEGGPGWTRIAVGAGSVDRYVQRLPGLDVDVVAGPGRGQTGPALRLLAGSGVLTATAADRAVLLDVGRLSPDSPAAPLLDVADVVLVLAPAWPEGMAAVREWRDRLDSDDSPVRGRARLVLVGQVPFLPREIENVLGLPVLTCLPEDPRGAAVLTGRASAGRGWTRLLLLRHARSLAQHLHSASVTSDDAPQPFSSAATLAQPRPPRAPTYSWGESS